MNKKIVLAVIFLLIFISFLAPFSKSQDDPGCCVKTVGCSDYKTRDVCENSIGGTYYDDLCEDVELCDVVCCEISPTRTEAMFRNTCNVLDGTGTFLDYFQPSITQAQSDACKGRSGYPKCVNSSCEGPVSEDCICSDIIVESGKYCLASQSRSFDDAETCEPYLGEPFDVTFNVFRESDDMPLGSVLVTFGGKSCETSNTGVCAIQDIYMIGEGLASVFKEGFLPASKSISSETPLPVQFTLTSSQQIVCENIDDEEECINANCLWCNNASAEQECVDTCIYCPLKKYNYDGDNYCDAWRPSVPSLCSGEEIDGQCDPSCSNNPDSDSFDVDCLPFCQEGEIDPDNPCKHENTWYEVGYICSDGSYALNSDGCEVQEEDTDDFECDETDANTDANCQQVTDPSDQDDLCLTNEPVLEVSQEFGSDEIELSWSFDGCSDATFEVKRNLGGGFVLLDTTTDRYFTDVSANSNLFLQYEVCALCADDQEYNQENPGACVKCSDVVEVETGDEYCRVDGRDFCSENKRIECLDDFTLNEVEDCGEGSFCSVNPMGETECIAMSQCEFCNGPYSMFYKLGSIKIPEFSSPVPCSSDFVKGCFVDKTPTTVDKYFTCDLTETCYDYHDESSCYQDPCGKGGSEGCSWNTNNDLDEFGLGVCIPNDELKQDCSQLDNVITNDILMNEKDVCGLLKSEEGACYFSNPRSVCRDKDYMGCPLYNTKEDCISSNNINSSYNVTWNLTNWEVLEGNNYPFSYSNDLYGLGTCKWVDDSNGGTCIKDANEDHQPDICIYCSDNEPPKTYIKPSGLTYYPMKFRVDIEAYDNFDLPSTYACFYNSSVGECYPQFRNMVSRKIQKDFSSYPDDDEDGLINQTLRIFSQDGSENLEVMNELNLIIDLKPPVKDLSFSNTSHFIADGPGWVSDLNVFVECNPQDSHWGSNTDCFCIGNMTGTMKGNDVVYPIKSFSTFISDSTTYTVEYPNLEDGDYVYHLECKDGAGNVVSEEKSFNLNADKRITIDEDNYRTFRNSTDFEFRVSTKEGKPVDYCVLIYEDGTNKTIFDTGREGIVSTETFNLDLTHGYHEYDIKCKFPGHADMVGGKEMGDFISYFIDEVPPPTTFLETNIEKNSMGYYEGHVDVTLSCKDPELNTDGHSGEFDNCIIHYSEGNYNDEATHYLTRTFTTSKTITYWCEDAGGNREPITHTEQIKVDTTRAQFDFKVYEEQKEVTGPLRPGYGYTFVITSTKPLDRAGTKEKEITFYPPEAGRAFSKESVFVENDMGNEIYELIVTPAMINPNLYDYDTLVNMSNIFINVQAMDYHGIEYSQMFTFGFDAVLPSKPTIEPETFFNGVGNNFYYGREEEEPYPFYNYENNGESVFYTNNDTFFVGGFVDNISETGLSARVEVLDYDGFDKESEFEYSLSNNIDTNASILIGDESFELIDNNTVRVEKDYVGTVFEGDALEFDNHLRTDYGNYGKFYTITDVNGVGDDYTDFVLDKDIELIDEDSKINVYQSNGKNNAPDEWFGMDVSINNLLHKYIISAGVYDDAGNSATDEFVVFVDDKPPYVVDDDFPSENEILSTRSGFNIEVMDDDVPLNTEMTKVYDNDEEISFIVFCSSSKNCLLQSSHDFSNENHTVRLELYDVAMNKYVQEWNFKVDNLAPRINLTLIPGRGDVEKRKYFTNSLTPDFTITFGDDEIVEIIGIEFNGEEYNMSEYLSYDEENKIYSGNLTLDNTTINNFDVMTTKYFLKGDVKERNDTAHFDIEVDTTPPEFNETEFDSLKELRFSPGIPKDISFEIPDEQSTLLDYSFKLNDTLPNVTGIALGSDGKYSMSVLVPEGSGFEEINAEKIYSSSILQLTDLAGNIASDELSVVIDTKPPQIDIGAIKIIPFYLRGGTFITRLTNIEINGTVKKEENHDFYDLMRVELNSYNPETGNRLSTSSLLEPVNGTFVLNAKLYGIEDEEIVNDQIVLKLVDWAGNVNEYNLGVIVDRLKPTATFEIED